MCNSDESGAVSEEVLLPQVAVVQRKVDELVSISPKTRQL